MEFFSRSLERLGSRARIEAGLGPFPVSRGRSVHSSTPSSVSFAFALCATASEYSASSSGSTDQSTLTEVAKWAMGFRSSPTLATPRFLHSTRVVPVPQNGSRTVSSAPTPRRSR